MSTYTVDWSAQGLVTLDAEDNENAVQEALDRVLDLEYADNGVTVVRVEHVKTTQLA